VEGFLSGMWTLTPDEEANIQRWQTLPPLTGVNYFPMVRAGGSVLARVDTDDSDSDGWPLFAMQRYGEGVCAVMAAGESWPWHMQTPLANDDHGRFWRQTIRGLVKGVPEPVRLVSSTAGLTDSQPAELRFLVRDALFTAREGLNTTVTAQFEGGSPVELPVAESIENSGVYTAEFSPEEAGRYLVNLRASTPDGETIGTLETSFVVHPDHREFQLARYDSDFLQAMAEQTNGRFFNLDQLASIPGEVPWPEGQHAVWRRIELWHWAGFFVALALLWSTEWYVRRRHGQA
jgi:hypothetical protein